MSDSAIVTFALIAAVAGIAYGLYLAMWVFRLDAGNAKMQEIAKAIQEGARAYMNRQYKTVGVVAAVLFVLLAGAGAFSDKFGMLTAVGFLVGASASALAGYVGMIIAVRANVRTAQAAHEGMNAALTVAFRGGAVTGLLLIGLGLLAITGFYMIAQSISGQEKAVHALLSLGFGGSLISVFARVGGGIYTKAADVGADLVGKVEAGIPEDDPRNPAVIADNVGDNVGDCAGMAADLFETYAVTTVAAMVLAYSMFKGASAPILYPLALGGVTIFATIIGILFVKVSPGGGIMPALYKGLFVAGGIAAVAFYPVTTRIMDGVGGVSGLDYYLAALVGLVVTLALVFITDYYTSKSYGRSNTLPKRVRRVMRPISSPGSRSACRPRRRLSWSSRRRSSAVFGSAAVQNPGDSMAWPWRPYRCSRWPESSWRSMRSVQSRTMPAASQRWPIWAKRSEISPIRSMRSAIPRRR